MYHITDAAREKQLRCHICGKGRPSGKTLPCAWCYNPQGDPWIGGYICARCVLATESEERHKFLAMSGG